jgi:cytochrome b
MNHETSPLQPLRVWDLPLRLFHWTLALAVLGLVITGQIGGLWIEWHGRLGLLVLGLLIFRLVWGLVGSTHARFRQFLPTPGGLLAYLRGQWQGVGHNPLGALSVFALLGMLAAQAITGLFANDDIAFRGVLYPLIDKGLSDSLTGWHRLLVNPLLALVALHIAAILFYAHVKGENLVRPMLTGIKQVPAPLARPVSGGGPLALLLAVLLAVGLTWALGSGSLSRWLAPPPPPPVALPAW